MAVADFSRINSNIGALNALNSLNNVNNKLGIHQMRLATGRRINSAADDPAGMTIATTMRQRNENLKTALDNIGDAKNLMSVAEAGLGKIQDLAMEMRNKAESAASDTLGSSERRAIQTQLQEYTKEINDIVDQTTWNGKKLLNGLGDFGDTISFQTGAEAGETTTLNSGQFASVEADDLNIAGTTGIGQESVAINSVDGGQTLSTTEASVTAGATGQLETGTYTVRFTGASTAGTGGQLELLDSNGNVVASSSGASVDLSGGGNSVLRNGSGETVGVTITWGTDLGDVSTGTTIEFSVAYNRDGDYNGNVLTATGAEGAMEKLDTAIDNLSNRLQTLGALSSRLTFKEENLTEAQVNTEAAFNRVMNADMAMNQLEATKYQILQQTATSMLSQANQSPQSLLSLFR